MAQSAGRAAIVPKGDWSASVAYTRLDAVVSNNILYIAKIDVPAGTPLTDTTHWFQSINGGEVPIATTTTAGKVKPDGTTITIDADGTIHGSANVNIATTTTPGIVKPDGETVTIQNDGTIASPNETVELTQAEYDALPSSKLTDGKVYMIKDASGEVPSTTSNKNLLDNGWFTVNQRGATSGGFSPTAYTVDRWFTSYGVAGATYSFSSDGFSATMNGADGYLKQKSETAFAELVGKTVTASVKMSDGTIYSHTDTFTASKFFNLIPSGSGWMLSFYVHANYDVSLFLRSTFTGTIRAVKLELGSISTLANDEAPDYATELLKCQRYYIRYASQGSTTNTFGFAYADTTSIAYAYVQLPTPMRATPTVMYSALRLMQSSGKDVTQASISGLNDRNLVLDVRASGLTTSMFYFLSVRSGNYLELSADL